MQQGYRFQLQFSHTFIDFHFWVFVVPILFNSTSKKDKLFEILTRAAFMKIHFFNA